MTEKSQTTLTIHDEKDDELLNSQIKMQQNNDVPVLPFPTFIWRIFLVFGVFLCSSYTIIVHLCEKDGRLPFSSAAVILMTELIKILSNFKILSTAILFRLIIK
ncbi:unnamed protein product, partial [Trichobilharzia szidati]